MSIKRLIAAWPNLSPQVQAAFVALVDAVEASHDADDADYGEGTSSWYVDPKAYVSATTIAKKSGLNPRVVRRVLARFRKKTFDADAYYEPANRTSRTPDFVYLVGAIAPAIDAALKARRPAKSPATKKAAA